MQKNTIDNRLIRTGVIAALCVLAFLGTLVIRIPIPATTGYFNIGDIFVILSGLWLGPFAGLAVGAIGPTVADAVGFPMFIPATMIVKGTEGFIVGILASGDKVSSGRKIVAAVVGGLIIVVGYFIFEAFIYPAVGHVIPAFKITDMGAALVEIIPNIIQASISIAGGIALSKVVSGVKL